MEEERKEANKGRAEGDSAFFPILNGLRSLPREREGKVGAGGRRGNGACAHSELDRPSRLAAPVHLFTRPLTLVTASSPSCYSTLSSEDVIESALREYGGCQICSRTSSPDPGLQMGSSRNYDCSSRSLYYEREIPRRAVPNPNSCRTFLERPTSPFSPLSRSRPSCAFFLRAPLSAFTSPKRPFDLPNLLQHGKTLICDTFCFGILHCARVGTESNCDKVSSTSGAPGPCHSSSDL